MRVSILLSLLTTAVSVFADDATTTLEFWAPDWSVTIPSYTSTAASITGINALATTYVLSCLKGAPTTLCDIKKPWTMIQGPETFSFTGVYTGWEDGKNGVTATRQMDCKLTSSSQSLSCTLSYEATGTYEAVTYATSTSTKASFNTKQVEYYELLVTGGVSSLTAPQATQTPKGEAAGPARALVTAAPMVAGAVIAALL